MTVGMGSFARPASMHGLQKPVEQGIRVEDLAKANSSTYDHRAVRERLWLGRNDKRVLSVAREPTDAPPWSSVSSVRVH